MIAYVVWMLVAENFGLGPEEWLTVIAALTVLDLAPFKWVVINLFYIWQQQSTVICLPNKVSEEAAQSYIAQYGKQQQSFFFFNLLPPPLMALEKISPWGKYK